MSERIKTHGYPLELKAADAFRRAGFDVSQSTYFQDDEGDGAMREIDVAAYASYSLHDEASGAELDILASVQVECKMRSEAWALLTGPSGGGPAGGVIRGMFANAAGETVLTLMSSNTEVQASPLFARPANFGYRLTELKEPGKGGDSGYAACMSAAKAARAESRREAIGNSTAILSIPLVLVEPALCEVTLDSAGDIKVTEVESAVVRWVNTRLSRGFTYIHVASASAMSKWAVAAKQSLDLSVDVAWRKVKAQATSR